MAALAIVETRVWAPTRSEQSLRRLGSRVSKFTPRSVRMHLAALKSLRAWLDKSNLGLASIDEDVLSSWIFASEKASIPRARYISMEWANRYMQIGLPLNPADKPSLARDAQKICGDDVTLALEPEGVRMIEQCLRDAKPSDQRRPALLASFAQITG